ADREDWNIIIFGQGQNTVTVDGNWKFRCDIITYKTRVIAVIDQGIKYYILRKLHLSRLPMQKNITILGVASVGLPHHRANRRTSTFLLVIIIFRYILTYLNYSNLKIKNLERSDLHFKSRNTVQSNLAVVSCHVSYFSTIIADTSSILYTHFKFMVYEILNYGVRTKYNSPNICFTLNKNLHTHITIFYTCDFSMRFANHLRINFKDKYLLISLAHKFRSEGAYRSVRPHSRLT
ncbi:hypothetical protein AGLY_006140, partial [Aphis glycines]